MARILWVLGLAAVAALILYGMRRGWVHRARRQAEQLAEFPAEPDGLSDEPELLPAAYGLYVGTTTAGDWQDRIAVGDIGHRANATAHVRRSGVLLQRSGAESLWIPAASLHAVRVDHKLANKVVPGAGMVVLTWQLGQQWLDTGFRAAGTTTQNEWAESIRELVPADEAAQPRRDETAGTRQEEV